jgi:two-component system response regulator RpaA
VARVLVIDDEQGIAQVIRLVLEAYGYDVLLASDGSRGFATAQKQAPDVIILDLMMPLMDGFAVLEALRDDERTAEVPVLVVSAVRRASVEEKVMGLGAKEFLQKPFDVDDLIHGVGHLAGASAAS